VNAMMFSIRRFRHYLKLSGSDGIYRRYFVTNSFDGVMTMLGIIIGAKLGGQLPNPRFVIGAGIGATLAMGISGLSGAYMTERAERMGRLRRLRRAMLSDLRSSVLAKASRAATLWAAIIDGLSPALAAAVPMAPFALAAVQLVSLADALLVSIAAIFVMLFLLGVFLGRVSRESVIIGGFRMLLVGVVTALILWGFALLGA
jgi:predicted membrane protein (TIGR00267 family)